MQNVSMKFGLVLLRVLHPHVGAGHCPLKRLNLNCIDPAFVAFVLDE
jgi:hypothetical protein